MKNILILFCILVLTSCDNKPRSVPKWNSGDFAEVIVTGQKVMVLKGSYGYMPKVGHGMYYYVRKPNDELGYYAEEELK